MNLFSYFVIALVFAENYARKVNFADPAIDINKLAKLAQASEESFKKEAGYKGRANLGKNGNESDDQDANIFKDTAILAKLINLVNKNAKTKTKKINSDELVTNQDTIQTETAKLAKLINRVNKGVIHNNFKKLSLSDQDTIINRKKSKLDKLIHLINIDNNKVKKNSINEAGRYEDNENSEENAQHMLAALAYLTNIHQGDKDKDVSEMEEEDKELNESPIERFGNDYYVVKNDDRRDNLKLIMSLIQSSFDQNTDEAGLRLHVIKNPEVLKKYKKQLKRRSNQPLLKDEDLPMNYNDFMMDLRRNAVFRLDESSEEMFLRSENKNDVAEIIKETVDKQYDSVKKSFDRVQSKNDDGFDDRDRNDQKKRNRNKDSKENNAWDVITKQYDWNNKPSSEYKHNLKDGSNKKVRKDDWDKTVIKNDDLDKVKKTKTSDDWDNKLKNNDEIYKKGKNNYWNDDINNNDKRNNNDRGKKVKNNDDWNQDRQNKNDRGKKEKTNDDWDQRIKNYDNPVQNKKPRNDNWENKKKNKYDDIDTKTPMAEKNIDDWSNTDNKHFNVKKQRDSGEKIKIHKIKDIEASFEIPKKERDIDYEPVKITTRKRKNDPYDDWDRPRPKKAYGREGGGFFGRTPIPFIGKRGIYVDK